MPQVPTVRCSFDRLQVGGLLPHGGGLGAEVSTRCGERRPVRRIGWRLEQMGLEIDMSSWNLSRQSWVSIQSFLQYNVLLVPT